MPLAMEEPRRRNAARLLGTFTEVDAPAKITHEQFFDPGDLGGANFTRLDDLLAKKAARGKTAAGKFSAA